MPTTNKRINLTVPDDLYQRLQMFREKRGIPSDAGACLQLINLQLAAFEQSEQMMELMSRFRKEDLIAMSNIGTDILKTAIDMKNQRNGK